MYIALFGKFFNYWRTVVNEVPMIMSMQQYYQRKDVYDFLTFILIGCRYYIISRTR